MIEQVITTNDGQLVIIDNTNWLQTDSDPMLPFALDELLCKQSAKSSVRFCHIWRHPNAFILGQQDARLPGVQAAMDWIQAQQCVPIVRNSGGAAVPLDDGVVNISLISPILSVKQHFHKDFELMVELIEESLKPYGAEVQKGEITGGYCPGDFDLSIHGFKFCGIAQRRQIHAYCVQAFVNVSGSGSRRASFVRHFYNHAAAGTAPGSTPAIIDNATASLEELLPLEANASFDLSSFVNDIKQAVIAKHHRSYGDELTSKSVEQEHGLNRNSDGLGSNQQSNNGLNSDSTQLGSNGLDSDSMQLGNNGLGNNNRYRMPDLAEITAMSDQLSRRYSSR